MAVVKRLCVFCGSSADVDQRYRDAATELGGLLARSGVELVYGGGRVGLMGLLADAALAAGGRVTGVIPRFLHDREVAHTGLSELIVVASMHERKRRMFDIADAFVALPGGLGTLDETIEIVTWRQLALHDKPIIVVDVAGYWAPLSALVEHAIAAGFAPARVGGLLHMVPSVADVLPFLARLPPPRKAAEGRLA
jgi:uncharacterized protein (TIGR00730 family)